MTRSNVQTSHEQAAEIVAEAHEQQRQQRLSLQEALARVIERRQIATNPLPVRLEEIRHEIPGSRFWGTARASVLRPTIEECRREVFGSDGAPFKTYQEAQRWMIANAKWGNQKEDIRQLERLYSQVRHRLKSIRKPKWWYVRGQVGWLTLQWNQSYTVNREAMATLQRHVAKMVQHTGWSERECLDLVLLDKSPLEEVRIMGIIHAPPREAGRTWFTENLRHLQTFTIEGVRRWHLHRPVFEGIADQVRRAMYRGQKSDELSLRDRLLFDAVVTVGRLPPRSRGQGANVQRTEYWEQLRVAWTELTGRRVGADALRKRWTRLPENVREMLEDVMRNRRTEATAHQKQRQEPSLRHVRKPFRKAVRQHGRRGEPR